jgi:hypothetical protein
VESGDIIVGVFNSGQEAQSALAALTEAGFAGEHLGFLMRGDKYVGPGVPVRGIGDKAEPGVAEGGTAGAVAGGILGALASGLIPGIGPVVAAGILASALAGAVAGGTVGSILGGFAGLGIPAHHAEYYRQEFEAGRAIVTVRAPGRAAEARAVLSRHGGYDIHRVPEGATYPAERDQSPLAAPSPGQREVDNLAHELNPGNGLFVRVGASR